MIFHWMRKRVIQQADAGFDALEAGFASIGDQYTAQNTFEMEMCMDMMRKGYLIPTNMYATLWTFERVR